MSKLLSEVLWMGGVLLLVLSLAAMLGSLAGPHILFDIGAVMYIAGIAIVQVSDRVMDE